jgi:hypothetical protein
MKLHAASIAFLAGPLLAAPSEVQSPIRALSEPAALLRGVGVQPGLSPGEFLISGGDFSAEVGPAGLEFTPILGARSSTTHSLSLSLAGMRRGAAALSAGVLPSGVEADGLNLSRQLGQGLEERFEASEEGVEFSYLFPTRPAGQGDLVVRLALDTSLGQPVESANGGLEFLLPDIGGVRIGAVTGIDALGQQVAGHLRYQAGVLELSLPSDFVDQATYPLLLDPLVGSVFLVSGDSIFATLEDTRPDLAYDATTDQYLIAWQRAISATESRIYARRFSGSGGAVAGIFQLSSTGGANQASINPAVANVNRPNRFVVVWEESEPFLTTSTSTSIQMQHLDANFSTVGFPLIVAANLVSGADRLTAPDVGAEGVDNDPGVLADFVVVWDDNVGNRLAYRHYGFDQGGVLDSSDPITSLVSDNPATLTSYGEPSIARASGVYNRSVVAATRFNALGTSGIRGWVMDLSGLVQGSSFALPSNSAGDARNPDIDGFDRQWVCAWEQDDADGYVGISAATVSLSPPTGPATVGPATVIASGSLLNTRDRPAVGYSFGKSWIAWRSGTFLGTPSVQLKGFDSATCTSCEGAFTLTTSNGTTDVWAAVATPTSGGAYYLDTGCAAFSFGDSSGSADLSAQMLQNNAQQGSYTNLGGGCGNAGTVGFNGAPSIGSSWWYTYLTGLPVTTLAAFYNISTLNPSLAIPCGACLWMPFEISGSSIVQFEPSGGTASAVAVIPCKPNLVGAQVTVQWTTFNPLTSPCPTFPSLSISDRWRVTIGQ